MDLYVKAQKNSQGDLIITFPLGPFKYLVIFVVATGAQMSAFQTEVAACALCQARKGVGYIN